MTLEELVAKLEGDDLKEAVVGLVNAEKEKGITSYRKKDGELLNFKTTLKSKGYDPETMKLDEWLSGFSKTEEKVRESSVTIAQLEDKLNTVQGQWESERTAAKQSKIQAELTSAIGNTFYGADYMIKAWIAEGKVDLVEGKVLYDGKTFNDALPTIKEENKGSLRVTQVPGSGDSGGSPAPSSGEKSFVDKVRAQMAANGQ
jgi:hypothetical protein